MTLNVITNQRLDASGATLLNGLLHTVAGPWNVRLHHNLGLVNDSFSAHCLTASGRLEPVT